MFVNYHTKNDLNIGDLVCAPCTYFPDIGYTEDINEYKSSNEQIILGGGGIFYPPFKPLIQQIINKSKKSIIWGAGTNTHDSGVSCNYCENVTDCDLVGMRDYNCGFEWVPCASCMSPLFSDQQISNPLHEYVIYMHYNFKFDILRGNSLLAGTPIHHNHNTSLSEVVKFLSGAQTVITNTYHGVYWATLLNKKVILYRPFSNKFMFMKHPPTVIQQLCDIEIVDAVSYPNALTECRKANVNFYNKVKNLS
jgi:Polysaccharide pyruvyl transferase